VPDSCGVSRATTSNARAGAYLSPANRTFGSVAKGHVVNKTAALQKRRSTMATSKDDAMLKAADLTAKQLRHAIDIVEGKLGEERAKGADALLGTVLLTLAEDYSRRFMTLRDDLAGLVGLPRMTAARCDL
jgi:hypothetical protein